MNMGAGSAALAMIAASAAPDEESTGRPEANPGDRHDAEPRTRRRILLVEDDFLVGMEIEAGLSEAGFEVAGVAASADEAIELAEQERPLLVVMDIRLAGARDGVDAAIEIERRLGIRALFASAHGDSEVRARAEAARPLGWIGKPYRVAALIAAVRDCLRQLDDSPRPEPRHEG